MFDISTYIRHVKQSRLANLSDCDPWFLVGHAEFIVHSLRDSLGADYICQGPIAVHASAIVESGAILKGPAIIGPSSFVAAGAYVRGGAWLEERCVLGPGVELKRSLLFRGAKLAHFNYVGDSILGADVNLEAGSIVANSRNERANKEIQVRVNGRMQGIGTEKFGALIGDGVRIGANAVIAPGALLKPGRIVPRLGHVEQEVP